MKTVKIPLAIGIIFFITGISLGFFLSSKGIFSKRLSPDAVKVKIEAFLQEKNVNYQIGTIKEFDADLYEVELISPQGNFFAYLSKSGNSLFQGLINLSENPKDAQNTGAATTRDIVKTEKPVVELFVMSHCPYGTQIEKGILPVANLLGDKIDFQLKFVNYAMHGEKEIDEQLNQYCIAKLYPEKFNAYLECFLADETGSSGCIQEQGISTAEITACVSESDSQFGITQAFTDKTTWKGSYPSFNIHDEDNTKYGVAGSPTLIINGVTSESGRSPQALLTAICAAFETAPEECSQTLSSDTPAPGFGLGQVGSATDASCE